MDYDDWQDEQDAAQAENDAAEAERRKAEVGMAQPESDQYYRNARYILESYLRPNKETIDKLNWLRGVDIDFPTCCAIAMMNAQQHNKNSLVFLSGSVQLYFHEYSFEDGCEYEKRVTGEHHELLVARFQEICLAMGDVLGRAGIQITGSGQHYSRLLASQEAYKGAVRMNPEKAFSTEGMTLCADEFARCMVAGIFIGGSSGTMDEFEQLRRLGIRPLIPIAGAGGTAQKLGQEMLKDPARFFANRVGRCDLDVLASRDASPESYAKTAFKIIVRHVKGNKSWGSCKKWTLRILRQWWESQKGPKVPNEPPLSSRPQKTLDPYPSWWHDNYPDIHGR